MTNLEQAQPASTEQFELTLEFSTVPGYRLKDFNFTCPTTSQPCPEQMKLISTYTRDIDEETVQSGEADRDVRKLQPKLTEYRGWGKFTECTPDEVCTIRTKMNESIPRQKAVWGFRTIRDWLRAKNITEEDR